MCIRDRSTWGKLQMMKRAIIMLVLVAALFAVGFSLREKSHFIYGNPFGLKEPKRIFKDQVQKWYEGQLLDHSSPLDTRTWRQRYWVINEFFDPAVGPVFVYICGEYTCQGLPAARQFPAQLAAKFKGLVLVLEHRFYGESQPFGTEDLTTERLTYLSVDQGLEDLAYFINWVKKTGQEGVTPKNKWVTIGGSYPGAMSAWFRYKYPHLTVGALASSAVINAIEDYWQYDDQLYTSTSRSGAQCPTDIRAINSFIEEALLKSDESAAEMKKSFNCDSLTNNEFLSYIGDIYAGFIQYGQRAALCDMIKKGGKDIVSKVDTVRQWALKNQDADDYSIASLANTTYDPNKSSRQWTYQTCTEFGWFQVASKYPDRAMRSANVSLELSRDICRQVFGYWAVPNTDLENVRFGGIQQKSFNIVFTNGGEDPWQWASLLKTDNPKLHAFPVGCNGCAHCVDLYLSLIHI
eukprot:TRINITY_DN3825_c0_g2_i3.p1 TRINITY_DN3825_c0_g2~~TRINITY_DN3825_c0_g2_i3.p1  ORF type:complete len:464 (+),score=101.88 TRINITY_DN3825_c0_g2_i3:65-1456(+)